MSASPAVVPSGDGATATQATQGYGPRPAEQLEDAPTIEFAPGLRRPVSLGTPPPPPIHLFESRLGRLERRPGLGRLRVLVPVVVAATVFGIVGLAMVLLNTPQQPSSGPIAQATELGTLVTNGNTAAPVVSESPTLPTPTPEPTMANTPTSAQTRPPAAAPPPATNPAPTQTQTSTAPPPPPPPPPPTATLTGPGSVTFGTSFGLNARDLPCGAGGQVTVTISNGATYTVAVAPQTDPQGAASVQIAVTDGNFMATTGPTPLTAGEWTVTVTTAAAGACTAAVSATAKVTVTP